MIDQVKHPYLSGKHPRHTVYTALWQ